MKEWEVVEKSSSDADQQYGDDEDDAKVDGVEDAWVGMMAEM